MAARWGVAESDDRRADGGTGSGGAFDPAVHGFGFRNWAAGDDERFPAHDHETIPEARIGRAVRGWIRDAFRDQFGVRVPVPDPFVDAVVAAGYRPMNRRSASGGHCYGMVRTATEYFREPDRVPAGLDVASDAPRPTGRYAAIGADVDFNHNHQYVDAPTWAGKLLTAARLPVDVGPQLASVRRAVDRTGLAMVWLGDGETGRSHQVLCYDYRRTPDRLRLLLYDPNHAADWYRDRRATLDFDRRGGEPTLIRPYDDTYDRVLYNGPGGVSNERRALGRLLGGLLTIDVRTASGARLGLAVVGPDGESLPVAAGDAATDRDPSLTVVGPEAGEYTLRVVAASGGDYAIDVRAASPLGAGIDERLSGRLGRGERREHDVTVPDPGPASVGPDDSPDGVGAWSPIGALGAAAFVVRSRLADDATDDA